MTLSQSVLPIYNEQAFRSDDCPLVAFAVFRAAVLDSIAGGARLSALFIRPMILLGRHGLVAVLSDSDQGHLGIVQTEVTGAYPSLTPDCAQAHWFEREIAEQWGIRPEGHPWLKPIRFQPPQKNAPSLFARQGEPADIGMADFFSMRGAEVHEVAVGPVHAGVIEPGHFRFQCHGETVYHLEISLGYQHRGIERSLREGPPGRRLHLAETLAGDTTIGHAWAYCGLMEALAGMQVPLRAQVIRGVAAELERLANHIGDLGAMTGDVGFLPTLSYCGRIRGDILNLTAMLCGNRFGRGLLRPGGVAWDLDPARIERFLDRLAAAEKDTLSALELMFSPSVLVRFKNTGTLGSDLASRIGLVGLAARACGLPRDIRHELPYGIYRFAMIPICTWSSGDCFARAYVRWVEIRHSFDFIREQLRSLPDGQIMQPAPASRPNHTAVSLVEGWRGEICHVAFTDAEGQITDYKVIDPSFHNWFGLACALRNQQISDFPLCNKSFNLSYCGHDL